MVTYDRSNAMGSGWASRLGNEAATVAAVDVAAGADVDGVGADAADVELVGVGAIDAVVANLVGMDWGRNGCCR